MFRLMIITILIIVGGGLAYLAMTQPNLLPSPLQSYAPNIRESVASSLTSLQTFISKGKDAQPAVMGVTTEASKVFQEDSTGKPVHQKAIEFTQYQYCKMVVKSYEEEQKDTSTVSPTEVPEEGE